MSVFASIARRLLAVPAILLLAACGGNGGGNNTSSGSSYSIALDRASLSFVANSNNQLPSGQAVRVSYQGDGVVVGFPPGSSAPTWLMVNVTGNQSDNPLNVVVSVNSTALAPGRHETTLRFATGNVSASSVVYRDLPISYTIPHVISPTSLEFNYVDGAFSAPATQTISIDGNNIQWEATASSAWIRLSRVSGNGSGNVDVTADPQGMAFGNYNGNITIRDVVTGFSRTAVVTMTFEPHRLHALRDGIALTSLPGAAHLAETIRITDNGGTPTRWTAVLDQSWLTLSTDSGTTDGTLTVTATPGNLSAGIHYATVTIAPDNEPTVQNTETIRVGLYISADAPAALVSSALSLSVIEFGLAADPIRPYTYVTQGGPSVEVYNVYSGALVRTYTIPGANLRQLAVSSNGSFLFAVDRANSAVVPIDLASETIGAPWTGMRFTTSGFTLSYARPNAIPALVTGDLQILDATNGAVLTSFGTPSGQSYSQPNLAVSPDGKRLFLQSRTSGTHTLQRYALSHRNGAVTSTLTHSIVEFGRGCDIAVDSSSTKLFSVSNDYAAVLVYDTANLARRTSLTANYSSLYNVEVDWQERVFVSNFSTSSDPDIMLYQPNTTVPSDTYNVAGSPYEGKLVLSGDGSRMITVSGDTFTSPRLSFVGIGQ